MSRPTAVLTGASGQIGIFAIPRLLGAGFDVLAVSRCPRPAWYPEFERVRWLAPGGVAGAVADEVQYLLSAGPIGVATTLAERCRGLRRAVVFSTSSVYSKAESPDRREQAQIGEIVRQEQRLGGLCQARDIPLALLRSTLIYGCGLDRNVSWLADWIRRFGFVPLAGAAAGLRQPVHAGDLARTAVAALAEDEIPGIETPLCGGSTLSYRDMVGRIFHALDRPERVVNLPRGLLVALVQLGRIHPRLRGVRPEMIRRQSEDLVHDDSPARERLGHAPRPFAPRARDFGLPEPDELVELSAAWRFHGVQREAATSPKMIE